MGRFISTQNELTGSLFGVGDGVYKDGVGPSTTKLTSHKFDCCIVGGYFVSYQSR